MAGKTVAEMTLADFVPYMSQYAKHAVATLCKEQGRQVDELDVQEVIDLANEYQSDAEVAVPFPCPRCGESASDYLVWDSLGEQVTCAMCGTTYTPGEEASA
jgi:predicted RNA-binding Zn-ribbon protein involved in translation (DUF1610 family)